MPALPTAGPPADTLAGGRSWPADAEAAVPDQARANRDLRLAGLLAGAANGNGDDFEAFYDATVGYARALGRRILAGADLDDALADAYLDAWRLCTRFDPARGSAVTWLLMLVHSRALDLWRRRAHAHPSTDSAAADSPAEPPARTDADPGHALWQLQAGQRLHEALDTLSPQERWVLGLAYFRELSHATIAQATGLPLGTVKSLIQRAHAKLKPLLADLADLA